MSDDTARPRLRDRTRDAMRDAVRAEIAERALELFDARGFDATTVDDIAEAVCISSRSFFRYFPAKEDVVIGDPTSHGLTLRDALAARPADEDPWTALRAALQPLVVLTAADPARSMRTMRIMASTPSLRARNLEKHSVWAGQLLPLVAGRLGQKGDVPARALVSCALACLDVALTGWAAVDGAEPFEDLLDLAFATVRR